MEILMNVMFVQLLRCILLVLAVALSGGFVYAKKTPPVLDDVLKRLDVSIAGYEYRLDTALNNIELLKIQLDTAPDTGEKMELVKKIVRGYLHRNVDSALHYSEIGERMAASVGDYDSEIGFKIGAISSMPLKGHIHEAIALIDSLNSLPLSLDLKLWLYKSARLAYMKILSFYSNSDIDEKYFCKFVEFNDSVLNNIDQSDRDYGKYLGTHYIGQKRPGLAYEALSDFLDSVDSVSNEYVEVQSLLSILSYLRGRFEDWTYRMALVAEAEAYLGNVDSEVLRLLANDVYEHGDIERAHKYMTLSHWFISKSGANQRGVHVAKALPYIIESYGKENRKAFYAMCGLMVCFMLIVILVLIIFRNKARDVKRLKEGRAQLANANLVKEAYIGQFMSLCSTYIERLEDYNKLIARKLIAGQTEEVCNMVRSEKFVESQVELFYEIFDNAFTHIYPTFIKDVNNLLVDDKTFEVGDGNKLTSELRILAFMRLGMADSAQMARFLRLSLNTVYTYRNRMRSKAKNRDTFEQDIAKIGFISAE